MLACFVVLPAESFCWSDTQCYNEKAGRMYYYSVLSGVDVSVKGCSFTNLQSTDADGGGAIYCWTFGYLSIQSSLFNTCRAKMNGGAISSDTLWMDLYYSCAVGC
jgi:hypothetical protein